MKDFIYWKKLHDNQELQEFSSDRSGLLWLKIKSITRTELVKEFIKVNPSIKLEEVTISKCFIELYNLLASNLPESHLIVDKFIRKISVNQRQTLNITQLVSELYKLKNFSWGGDYQNSLDKYLVSRYVKFFTPYETLISKLETEINYAVQGYVLNSWYNHWSSILIEHIFKSHESVLPTVGQIKNVDFFINDIPFDLKVTYLPAEYIRQARKKKGLPVELTFLKKKAAEAGIAFDKTGKPEDIYYEIVEKMREKKDAFCISALETIKNEKLHILNEVIDNPKILIKWLYENQGEMRFSSENRLFLVLVDVDDFNNSWKLKRNIELLRPSIIAYLNNFANKRIGDLQITFNYKGKTQEYTAIADILFVIPGVRAKGSL